MISHRCFSGIGSLFPLHLNWNCCSAKFTYLLILLAAMLVMLGSVLVLLNLNWGIVISYISFVYFKLQDPFLTPREKRPDAPPATK